MSSSSLQLEGTTSEWIINDTITDGTTRIYTSTGTTTTPQAYPRPQYPFIIENPTQENWEDAIRRCNKLPQIEGHICAHCKEEWRMR